MASLTSSGGQESEEPASLIDTVEKFLEDKNWAYSVDSGDSLIRFTVRINGEQYPMDISVRDDTSEVVGYLIFTKPCPRAAEKEMANLFSAMNNTLSFGGCEMDADRVMKFRNSLSLSGVTCDADYFDRFLMRIMKDAMTVARAIRAVTQGETALQAISLIC